MKRPKLEMNFFILFLFTFSVLRSTVVVAQENTFPNLISATASSINTTSEFQSDNYSLNYKTALKNSSELSLGIESLYTTGTAANFKFNFQNFGINLENSNSSRKLYAKIAFDKRTINQSADSTNLLGMVGGDWVISKSNIAFEFGRKSFAQELQSLTSVRDNLTGSYYVLRYNLLFSERWQIRALNKSYFISDSNNRTDSDVGLMYGISPSWPWIWVGFGAEYLTNSIANTTGYWSPRKFLNLGPRLDVAFPLFDKYSFSAGLNLNKYNDFDFGDGTGFYSLAKIVHGGKDSLKVEAGIESISSEQNSNRWTSSMFFVGVSCPF